MQGDPIKPTLKPPGTKRLKLICDKPPSSFAFNFKLRRYTMVLVRPGVYAENVRMTKTCAVIGWGPPGAVAIEVGWCRLTLSNPR
jgi:hypothetical protein